MFWDLTSMSLCWWNREMEGVELEVDSTNEVWSWSESALSLTWTSWTVSQPISFTPGKPMVHANVVLIWISVVWCPSSLHTSSKCSRQFHFSFIQCSRQFHCGSVKTASLLKSLPSLCTISLQAIPRDYLVIKALTARYPFFPSCHFYIALCDRSTGNIMRLSCNT